jgi:hypothetical protein
MFWDDVDGSRGRDVEGETPAGERDAIADAASAERAIRVPSDNV